MTISQQNKTGKFITIEGIDGVGKSSAIKYLQKVFQDKNQEIITTREPGGTPIAEEIRQFLKAHHEEKMCPETEILLFFAARAQHLNHVILPSIERGEWVLSDRFTDATYAYQSGGRGIDKNRIAILENYVQGDFRPDITILLHAPIAVALSRANHRGSPDRFEKEKEEFFERVQNVYFQRAKEFPNQYKLVDASQPLKQVQIELDRIIESII